VTKNGQIIDLASLDSGQVSLEQIEALLAEAQADQELLQNASNWNTDTATDSAKLAQLVTSNLFVTNQATLNSLSVANSTFIGTDMVIQALDTSEPSNDGNKYKHINLTSFHSIPRLGAG